MQAATNGERNRVGRRSTIVRRSALQALSTIIDCTYCASCIILHLHVKVSWRVLQSILNTPL